MTQLGYALKKSGFKSSAEIERARRVRLRAQHASAKAQHDAALGVVSFIADLCALAAARVAWQREQEAALRRLTADRDRWIATVSRAHRTADYELAMQAQRRVYLIMHEINDVKAALARESCPKPR